MLFKYVEDNYEKIIDNIKLQYKKNIDSASVDVKQNELDKLNFIEKRNK